MKMNQNFSRIALLLMAVLAQFSMNAFNVTFRVDMSQQTDFTTPEVNGSFNNWCGNCFQMTDADGDNIWEATTDLAPGTYEYKFSADAWGSQEILVPGSPCTVTNFGFTNRTLVVTQETVLPVVCWGACVECAAAPVFYDITFQVDMSEQTGFTTPEVNGTFNGWCGNCTAMQDLDGDGIWSITVSLQEGTYEYKFSHDNWGGQESLTPGSSCTVTTDIYTNRTITVSQDEVLPAVCFGSCALCGVNTGPFDVTFNVDMNDVAFPFTTPEVNGTFNNWCGSCAPMSDADGDNIWSITIPLQAGSYDYKFSYDNWSGQESLTPGSACTVTLDAFTNRTIEVSGPINLAEVCWESCSPCSQQPVLYNVEFQVDMQGVPDVTSVEVNGTFNNWCGACFPLSDPDGNGLWTGTAQLEAGSYEYKFTYNGGQVYEQLNAGDACTITTGDFTNRALDVVGDAVLPVVCWQSCVNCGNPLPQYNVTFQVDMQNVTDFSIPEVNGTFNNWCGGCFALTDDDGDGIWTGTAAIDEGIHEYKFAYDAWLGQENLLAGLPCTVTNFGFTNRSLNVVGDIVLPVVCWESCGDCSQVPVTHEVTFQVDMNGVTGFTTPEVNGTFNNWCGNCFQMTDDNGDGIWQATTTLQEGIYEFKFSYDNWAGSEQLASGDPCTVTNGSFVNRLLNLQSDTLLAPVCWALCGPCTMPEPVTVVLNLDLGDVVATSAEVSGTFNNYCVGCQPMTSLGNNQYTVELEVMPGVHYYQFTINGGTQLENLTEGSCTVAFKFGITRELVVSEDVNVGMVCWESCAPCLVNVDELNAIEFVVSPNPADAQFMIQFNQAANLNYSFMDQTGRIIVKGSTAQSKQIVIPTEQLPAGMYQVLVTNGTNQITQKIIVQH
jgi:1,4-alpha-glucan branching enzyme